MRYLVLGTIFGFILERVGATKFDAIWKMFRLEDLHLAGVIATAILFTAPLLYLLRRAKIAGPGPDHRIQVCPKPRKRGLILGSLTFGSGWAMTGTCPGTALAQLGSGQLAALFVIGGILVGIILEQRAVRRDAEAPQAIQLSPSARDPEAIPPA